MGFGPADAGVVNDAASAAAPGLLGDLFGPTLDTALVPSATDKVGAKCQSAVAKEGGKCVATWLKEFNRCKKSGLKDGTIGGGPDLAACLGSDPKGKIAKSCSAETGKLATKVLPKKCGAVDLAAGFPGCAAADAGALATCVEQSARCRVCTALSQADGFDGDCDAFDDGVSNASCP